MGIPGIRRDFALLRQQNNGRARRSSSAESPVLLLLTRPAARRLSSVASPPLHRLPSRRAHCPALAPAEDNRRIADTPPAALALDLGDGWGDWNEIRSAGRGSFEWEG